MPESGPRRGHYLGTEVDERWWRRYAQEGFLARGTGTWWLDDEAFRFHRTLTRAPLAIAFADVLEVKLGRWHAGRWAGGAPVVKLVWARDGARLGSGFVIGRDPREAEALARAILSRVRTEQAPAGRAARKRPAEG